MYWHGSLHDDYKKPVKRRAVYVEKQAVSILELKW